MSAIARLAQPFSQAAPTRKGFRQGAHRLVAPAETVRRMRGYQAVMGITRIADVTGLDRIGLPVVMVYRPNSRSVAVWPGKGMDLAAAQASGLMEAIETYHAEHITLPLKLAAYEELRYTHHLADVALLPLAVDGMFDLYAPVHWIEGYDLLQDTAIWLPYDLVHTNYTVRLRAMASGFLASSNGLASGNHRLEAISHGICELVERDALALWSLQDDAARAQTRLDLATVTDPSCVQVLDQYRQAQVAVGVWEITSDIGIPAFLVRIMDPPDHPWRRPTASQGYGCHPARGVALLRALTEAAQTRLTRIVASRDDLELTAADADAEALAPLWTELAAPGPRQFSAIADWDADTFEADVTGELDRLCRAGITSVIVVDLTRPEFGIPVVRVVIPGLEYLTPRGPYLPGRRARRRLEAGA